MEIGSLLSAAETNPGTSNANGIAGDFNTFLTLLTTQLQNQDPLEPTDTNEFTNQLVAFAGVEQQIRTNDNLQALANLAAFNKTTAAVGFLGREATLQGDAGVHAGDGISFQYSLPKAADRVSLEIVDTNGNVVFEAAGETNFGLHEFDWPGLDANGALAPEGQYRLRISARGEDNAPINATTLVRGIVAEVETSGGEPLLTVAGRQVPLDAILAVRDPQ